MNLFKKEYFLIGYANKSIGRNPPTLKRLLQNCVYYREQKKSIDKSVSIAIKNAMVVWSGMGAIKRSDNCERKLKREFLEWIEINKNKKYKSSGQKQKREEFVKKLNVEFDVTTYRKSFSEKNKTEESEETTECDGRS